MATPFTTYKLIILYMLQHSDTTLTNSQISEFILDREYTSYFHLQQAISELVEADLVEQTSIGNASHYNITEEGRLTLSYFENEISNEIRSEVMEYLRECGYRTQQALRTPADYYPTPQGRYDVRCQVIEKNATMLDVRFQAPNEEAAKAICKNWQKKYQNIYETLMEELL
jgi:predicted transcriptional regulator